MFKHTDRFGRVHECATAAFVVTGEYSGHVQSHWYKTREDAKTAARRLRRELIGVEIHEAVQS